MSNTVKFFFIAKLGERETIENYSQGTELIKQFKFGTIHLYFHKH